MKLIKRLVKANPFLYKKLYPLVQRRREADEQRLIKRFRDYCQEMMRLIPQPVLVKVGANDGLTHDMCSDIFLANENSRGLLIEPVPHCFAKLKKNFGGKSRFVLAQVAIGSPAGEASFYYVDAKAREKIPDWQEWYDLIGSFNRQHILKQCNGLLAPYIAECKVAVLPLTDLLVQKQFNQIHVLDIDAEGYDYEVIKTLDFTRFPPQAIMIEHGHLSPADKEALLNLMNRHGYRVLTSMSSHFAINQAADRRMRDAAKK